MKRARCSHYSLYAYTSPAITTLQDKDFLFRTAPQAFTGTKTYIAFQDSYEAEFEELPDVPYTDMAYDATMILALAIAKVGSTEGS
ncbi:MAG: hypothetical protein F6K47_22735 [Symploca sp. SIO2E6]|nr:hypothetical protein [Symploca sp. SIO2E6]